MSRYELANENSDIMAVARFIGMEVPDFSYSASIKLYCPFGEVSHADGGSSKAFRIYPETNSAYCFACGLHFSPVKLLATATDISTAEAADYLLELAGVTEAGTEERWEQLTSEQESPISTAELAEALKVYCSRIDPNWAERQLEPAVAHTFQRCLGLLGSVRTSADAEQWLGATKQVMAKNLGVTS
jgi:hypothetical protein